MFWGRSVRTLTDPCGGVSNPPDQAKGPSVLVIVMPASNSLIGWLGLPATTLTRLAGPVPIDGLAFRNRWGFSGLGDGIDEKAQIA